MGYMGYWMRCPTHLTAIDAPFPLSVDEHEDAPQSVYLGTSRDEMNPSDHFFPGNVSSSIAVKEVEEALAEGSGLLARFEFGEGCHHFGELDLFESLAALELLLG